MLKKTYIFAKSGILYAYIDNMSRIYPRRIKIDVDTRRLIFILEK